MLSNNLKKHYVDENFGQLFFGTQKKKKHTEAKQHTLTRKFETIQYHEL